MATTNEAPHVIVCGAGLVGSLAALLFGQRGFKVTVYEGMDDIRNQPQYTGRSINLALSARGLEALDLVSMREEWEERGISMTSRFIHNEDGSQSLQPYGINGQSILSVSRRLLNERLLEEAEKLDNVTVFFNTACVDVDYKKGIVTLSTGEQSPAADLVVGADGAYSKVRTALLRSRRFNYSQWYIPHGYKELSIPAVTDADLETNPDALWSIPKNHLHIWPRGTFMLIALPNEDGTFTVTLFMPFEDGFDAIKGPEQVERFITETFPDAVPHLKAYQEEWVANRTGNLVTIKCGQYHYSDRVVLMGDAAHGMTPFYGQGMNAAFADVTALANLMDEYDWDTQRREMLEAYSARQVPSGHAICDLALQNYVEMRSHTASRWFRMRIAFEKMLHRWLGDRWIPLYSMVAFTTMPYNEAVDRNARQQAILSTAGTAVTTTVGAGLAYAAAWAVCKFVLGWASVGSWNALKWRPSSS